MQRLLINYNYCVTTPWLYLTRKYGIWFLDWNSKAAQIIVFDTNLPVQLDLLLLFFQTPGAGKLTNLPPTLLGLSKLIASAHTRSLENTLLIVFCPVRTQSLQNQHKSHLLHGTIPVLSSILCGLLICRNHITEEMWSQREIQSLFSQILTSCCYQGLQTIGPQ